MAERPDQRTYARPHAARLVASVAAWLLVWQLVAWAVGNELLLAGPLETLQALGRLVAEGELWGKVAWSFVRIAAGFGAAFVLGLALALLAWRSAAFELFLRPAMLAVKSTPLVCIIVMLLIWFGSSIVSGIATFLMALPALYFSALEGLRALDAERLAMLRLYRVGLPRRLGAYVWPALQPFLLATSRLVVGMSWKAGVAAELIGTPFGSIGERIYQSKILLETADLFAWTIVVVAMAALCERAFLWLLGRSAAWSQRAALRAGREGGAVVSEALWPAAPLRFARVSRSFGDQVVLDGVSLDLAAGSRCCVMGPSGVGKTTLLRLGAHLDEPSAGEAPTQVELSFAWQATCLLEDLSAVENLLLVCGQTRAERDLRALLGEILPPEAHDGPVSRLSGGERRRVELARALAAPGSAVLLDEPFSSLDEQSHRTCAAFVLRHLARRTLLVATHDEADAVLLDAEVCRLG